MNKYKSSLVVPVIFITLITLFSCDGGLAPKEPTLLNGTLIFKGGRSAWPKDSMFAIRVVAFKTYPPQDIFTEVISGNAIFTDTLRLFVDSAAFTLDIPDAPVEYKYIVAAQQYDSSIFAQRAIGVFTETGDVNLPSSIFIKPEKKYYIRINIDFKNLPPQPF